MSMQKPVNYRAFIVVSAAVTAAVLAVFAYMYDRTLGIVIASVIFCGISVPTCIFIVGFIRRRKSLGYAIGFALSLVLSVTAFTVGVVTADEWSENISHSGYVNVEGRVCDFYIRSGDYKFYLEDIYIDGTHVSGKMRIDVAKSDNNIAEILRSGDRISFDGFIKSEELFDNGKVDGSVYRTDVRYIAKPRADGIKIVFGEPDPIEKMLGSMHSLFVESMGDKYGNIAFSIITGDKNALDGDVTDYFSAAGLGHIMAVSGLHIGFVAAVLSFLLRKTDKRVRFAVTAAVMAAYTVIADFSPSVVRAVIMTLISMFAFFVGGRRDMLSSLLCAYSFILAVKPLYLFEVGFQLSFGAIFGIAMFAGQISRRLGKFGVNRKVSGVISSALSVQIGIIPIEIYSFGSVQMFAFILNAVLMPYISIVFVATLVLAAIAAIPGCGAALSVVSYLMIPLDYISYGIASIPFSVINIAATSAVYLCYPVMFVASEHFMLPRGKRAIFALSAAAYIFFCLIS